MGRMLARHTGNLFFFLVKALESHGAYNIHTYIQCHTFNIIWHIMWQVRTCGSWLERRSVELSRQVSSVSRWTSPAHKDTIGRYPRFDLNKAHTTVRRKGRAYEGSSSRGMFLHGAARKTRFF
jgi:pyruvate/2-oxoacid:ferredoxin oxidoreductase beta subunit|eukprot:COSAG01_NODE_3470_length_6049_cov_689.357815_10_plen_123_part_00